MLLDDIRQLAKDAGAELTEKKGRYTFKKLVAERKAFLSKQRLEYIAQFRIADDAHELHLTEMLKESSFGLSTGGDDDAMSPGFGFKTGVYKTGLGGREGTIEQQSDLFGKKYDYKFDFKALRSKFEAIAAANSYTFRYHITPVGL